MKLLGPAWGHESVASPELKRSSKCTCKLILKNYSILLGICLCADKDDKDWKAAWEYLKSAIEKIEWRTAIFKQAYKGESIQAGKTVRVHQLAVDKRYRRMTVGYQLLQECVKRADDNDYHRVSILCTDAFSPLIAKKLKFEKSGESVPYSSFKTEKGKIVYNGAYLAPHKEIQNYALRLWKDLCCTFLLSINC